MDQIKKAFALIDELIEKIPGHIRDIIQKASIASLALIVLVVIIMGIQRGYESAKPLGMQLAKNSKDLFYISQLREENAKKIELNENIEINLENSTGFDSEYKKNPIAHDLLNDELPKRRNELARKNDLSLIQDEINANENQKAWPKKVEAPLKKRSEELFKTSEVLQEKQVSEPVRDEKDLLQFENVKDKKQGSTSGLKVQEDKTKTKNSQSSEFKPRRLYKEPKLLY